MLPMLPVLEGSGHIGKWLICAHIYTLWSLYMATAHGKTGNIGNMACKLV